MKTISHKMKTKDYWQSYSFKAATCDMKNQQKKITNILAVKMDQRCGNEVYQGKFDWRL